jgi:predicted alpha/beta-fold hydrolase
MTLAGHLWTVVPHFARKWRPTQVALEPWASSRGPARLSGSIVHAAKRDALLVVLHGLGGSVDRPYMRQAAATALATGVGCLLLNARGADLAGTGLSHAGLTDDVRQALAEESLRGYERIYLLGFSMGGHLTLKFLAEDPDRRVRAGVAVCSPVDLEASMRAFDRPNCYVYRRQVLRGLAEVYAASARTERLPATLSRVRAVRRMFEWDELVVAPYFGFESPWDYYERASAAGRLAALARPALYIGASGDPMVPKRTVDGALARANERLTVHFHDGGGHLGFPESFTLGENAPPGVEAQAVAWLLRH